jgi:predicted dehydrogenase
MSAVKIGIVGLGQRGLQHLNSLWKVEDAEVVALCDPTADNLAEKKIAGYVDGFHMGDIKTYTNFSDFFTGSRLDAIYFAIPPSLHEGEILQAAERGVHLFVEKPVSLFLDEALEMERVIERSGIIATVGFNQRHDSWHTGIREFLADKRLVMITDVVNGTLESHSVKHTRTEAVGGPQNRVWAANRSWSGGTIVEAGIHQTDLMRYWAGDIDWVEARYIHRDAEDIEDGGDNPYAYSVTYGFSSGVIANLMMSRLRKTFWGDAYQDIIWDRGHLKLEKDGPVAYYYDGPYPPEGAVDQEALRHPLSLGPRNNNTLEISRSFVQAVKEQSSVPLLNTFSSSINSHAAVLGANVSDALDGQRVVLSDLLTSDAYARFRQKPSHS